MRNWSEGLWTNRPSLQYSLFNMMCRFSSRRYDDYDEPKASWCSSLSHSVLGWNVLRFETVLSRWNTLVFHRTGWVSGCTGIPPVTKPSFRPFWSLTRGACRRAKAKARVTRAKASPRVSRGRTVGGRPKNATEIEAARPPEAPRSATCRWRIGIWKF